MLAGLNVRTIDGELAEMVPKDGATNLRFAVPGETADRPEHAPVRRVVADRVTVEDRSAAGEEASHAATWIAKDHRRPLCRKSTALSFPMIEASSRWPNKSR